MIDDIINTIISFTRNNILLRKFHNLGYKTDNIYSYYYSARFTCVKDFNYNEYHEYKMILIFNMVEYSVTDIRVFLDKVCPLPSMIEVVYINNIGTIPFKYIKKLIKVYDHKFICENFDINILFNKIDYGF